MIGADAELTIEADLVVINDELTIEDELLTGLTKLTTDDGLDAVLLIDELTECLTVENSELTECLTDELTVLLTVDGLKLLIDELT